MTSQRKVTAVPQVEIPTVSSAELRPIVEGLSSLFGEPPVIRALARSGLSRAATQQHPVQVARAMLLRFIEDCAREAGEPLLGAILGSHISFQDFGPAGRYIASANTLTRALTRLSKVVKYHETGSRIDYVPGSNVFRVVYHPPTPRALGNRHQCDGFAAQLVNLVRRYEGPRWKPRKLMLPAAEGSRLSKLEAFFGTKIAPSDKVVEMFGSANLNRQLADTSRTDVAAPSWRELRQLIASRPSESYAGTVQELMKPIMRDGYFRLDQICARIGVEQRTLQRRLAHEGQSFTALQSNVRREWAEQLLAGSTLTQEEIGRRLGFSSSQHFIRAFTCWTGTSPGTYRKVRSQTDRTADLGTGWIY